MTSPGVRCCSLGWLMMITNCGYEVGWSWVFRKQAVALATGSAATQVIIPSTNDPTSLTADQSAFVLTVSDWQWSVYVFHIHQKIQLDSMRVVYITGGFYHHRQPPFTASSSFPRHIPNAWQNKSLYFICKIINVRNKAIPLLISFPSTWTRTSL
jgi:hypothetical protein